MKLVLDTNRIIAALVKNSASREILLSGKFEFLTVGVSVSEIEEHKEELLMRTKMSAEDFGKLLSLLLSKVKIVNDTAIQSKMKEAKVLMDKVDPDDTPFIALALATENDGVWSNDKHFDRQDKIKVWKTQELLKLL